MSTDASNHRLARYLVQESLGRGGMGEVYRVWDPVLRRHLALKLVHGDLDDPFRRLCFEREVRTLRQAPHDSIVQLHDLGSIGEHPFYTMELLAGQSWAVLLERPLPDGDEIRWTLRLFCQLLDVVHHLHRVRILHRDLKPDNVIIVPSTPLCETDVAPSIDGLLSDPTASVKLMDFGLALDFEEHPEAEKDEPGTPLYIAPERHQSGCRADPRSDLYSLGVLLYQTLTRSSPFATISDAITGRRPPRDPARIHPKISPELSAIILRQLDFVPHRRSSSAADLRAEILALLDETDLSSHRILAPVFHGRTEEIEKLDALARSVCTSVSPEGQLVLIDGSTGSGKSALIDQSDLKTRLVLDHGMEYLHGSFDEQGSLHQGLRSLLLDRLFRLPSRLEPKALMDRLGPWIRELFGALDIDATALGSEFQAITEQRDDPLGIESPELFEQYAVDCALDILTDGTDTSPLAILLDDVHWADELDLEVLRQLTRRLSKHRILLVLTWTSHSSKTSRSLERWRKTIQTSDIHDGQRQQGTALHLEGLSDSGVERLLVSMLESSGTVSPELVSQIVDESKGYPGAVARCLRERWSRGHIQLEDGRWVMAPTGALDASQSDDPIGEVYPVLDTLGDNTRRVVEAAAVLGENFDTLTLTQVLSNEVPEVERSVALALRELLDLGLLDSTGELLRFTSSTLRRRCLARLPEKLQQTYHGRVASLLLESRHENANEILPRLADHFEGSGDPETAERYRLKGARTFAQKGALRRSLESYQRLLDRPETQTSRAILLREVAVVHRRLGDFDVALRCLVDAAAELNEGPDLLEILEEQGRIHQRRGDLDAAEELFQRCREMALGDPKCAHCIPELLYSLGGLQFERNAWDSAAALFEDSLSRFRSGEDLKGMAKVSLGLGLADMRRGHRDEAMTHIQEAIDSAERVGITDVLSAALNNLSTLQRARGDNDASINSLKRSLEIRRNVGDRPGIAICVNNLSRAFWFAGDLHNAVDSARDAHERFRELGDKKGVFVSGSNLGGFLLYRGDVEDAQLVLQENLERARDIQNWRAVVDTLQSLAFLHQAAGQPEKADLRFQEGLRRLADITDSGLRATMLAAHAVNCLRLGRREAAQDALRDSLDTLTEIEGREAHGWVQLAQSEFHFQDGEIDEAMELAQAALSTFETAGSRLDTAVANRQLARTYREMGPDWVDRTERHFQLASESLETMGARMQLGLTLLEEAQLWSHLEETEESLYCLEEAARLFRECGASRRVEEAERQIALLN